MLKIDLSPICTKPLNYYTATLLSRCNADSNECFDGNNDCSENAECFDTPELFGCTCNEGFEGDGRICNGECIYIIDHVEAISNMYNYHEEL